MVDKFAFIPYNIINKYREGLSGMTSRRISYFKKMGTEVVLAQRSSIMRSCAVYGDYDLIIEKEEWRDSDHNNNVFYVIGVEGNGGFDYIILGVHNSLRGAWEDYNFIVGSGLSCPLAHYHETDVVINYITGEILEYPVITKESQLLTLAEHLYDMWGYQPVSRKWQEKLDKIGVADFQIEDGRGYVSVFWNEENEFFIRQYGF